MTQLPIGFPLRDEPAFQICQSKEKVYVVCGRKLLLIQKNFSMLDTPHPSTTHPRCKFCCRTFETIWDHAMPSLHRLIKLRRENIVIDRNTKNLFWKFLALYYQPLYSAALKTEPIMQEMEIYLDRKKPGPIMQERIDYWDKKVQDLIYAFLEKIISQGLMFPDMYEKGKPKRKPFNEIYMNVFVTRDTRKRIQEAGCPFGKSGRALERSAEQSPIKLPTHDTELYAIWTTRDYTSEVEDEVKERNLIDNGIKMENLLMQPEEAFLRINEAILKVVGKSVPVKMYWKGA